MSCDIIVADALPWLEARAGSGLYSIVTSLPDAEEVGLSIGDWSAWFQRAAALCFGVADDAAPVVFYQTDRRAGGETISKAGMMIAAARACGARMIWHKIVLRRAVGAVDLYRPAFTHLLAFGGPYVRPGKPTPDVIPAGEMLYPNAMGDNAAAAACEFVARHKRPLLDPFCGRGAILVAGMRAGLDVTGIDIDERQAEEARRNTSQTNLL